MGRRRLETCQLLPFSCPLFSRAALHRGRGGVTAGEGATSADAGAEGAARAKGAALGCQLRMFTSTPPARAPRVRTHLSGHCCASLHVFACELVSLCVRVWRKRRGEARGHAEEGGGKAPQEEKGEPQGTSRGKGGEKYFALCRHSHTPQAQLCC